MTARMLLAWIATVGVAVSAIGLSASTFAQARRQGKQSISRLERCRSDAERAQQLRFLLPACLSCTAEVSSGPLGPRLHKVLAGVNLASGVLTNLAPQSGTSTPLRTSAVGDRREQLVQERVAIKLEPLTLLELGTFLKAWQSTEPCWSISQIDVAPILADRGASPAPGSDLPVRASMTLETLTLKATRGVR